MVKAGLVRGLYAMLAFPLVFSLWGCRKSGVTEAAGQSVEKETQEKTESREESLPEQSAETTAGFKTWETSAAESQPPVPAESGAEASDMPKQIPETLSEGADIRVISFNILVEGSGISLDGRAEGAIETILKYRPDVIGLQEVDKGWYDRLQPGIGDTYEFLYTDNTQGGINRTTAAYNAETVTPVDDGVVIYSQGASPNDRVMTWGVFETVADQRRFAVINTHWDTNRLADNRFVQAEEMGKKVLEIREKYQCPVICTGDFNTNRMSGEFKKFLELSQTADAQANVEEQINGEYRSQHTLWEMPDRGKTSIDHITYTEDIKPVVFAVLAEKEILGVSDHCPLLIDLAWKE